MGKIKVYGADWCSMTVRTREHLDRLGVAYTYVDVEADPSASQWVKDQNDGLEKKPTLDIIGLVISEPTNRQLDEALRTKKIID